MRDSRGLSSPICDTREERTFAKVSTLPNSMATECLRRSSARLADERSDSGSLDRFTESIEAKSTLVAWPGSLSSCFLTKDAIFALIASEGDNDFMAEISNLSACKMSPCNLASLACLINF